MWVHKTWIKMATSPHNGDSFAMDLMPKTRLCSGSHTTAQNQDTCKTKMISESILHSQSRCLKRWTMINNCTAQEVRGNANSMCAASLTSTPTSAAERKLRFH